MSEWTNEWASAHFFQRKSKKSDTLAHNLAGSHMFISIFLSIFSIFFHYTWVFLRWMVCCVQLCKESEWVRARMRLCINFNTFSMKAHTFHKSLFMCLWFKKLESKRFVHVFSYFKTMNAFKMLAFLLYFSFYRGVS